MKRRYPKLIDLLVENEESNELIVFDEDDPEMQVRGGSKIKHFFKKIANKLKRKKGVVAFDEDDPAMQISGDPDADLPSLGMDDIEITGNPLDAIFNEMIETYEFKLGTTMKDAQKLVGRPKPGTGAQPITFLITQTKGVFMRVPGAGGFEQLESPYDEIADRIIKLYKDLGGEILNESLSRGSLYRRRYHGRY